MFLTNSPVSEKRGKVIELSNCHENIAIKMVSIKCFSLLCFRGFCDDLAEAHSVALLYLFVDTIRSTNVSQCCGQLI